MAGEVKLARVVRYVVGAEVRRGSIGTLITGQAIKQYRLYILARGNRGRRGLRGLSRRGVCTLGSYRPGMVREQNDTLHTGHER